MKYVVLICVIFYSSQLIGQSWGEYKSKRIRIVGKVYERILDTNSRDTLYLKNCLAQAIKDTVLIQANTNEFGSFEMTLLEEYLFDKGVIISVNCKGYDSAYTKFSNYPPQFLTKNFNWKAYFEMEKK